MINSILECRRLLDNVLSVAVQNATMKCVFKENQCYKAPPPHLDRVCHFLYAQAGGGYGL